MIIRTVLLSIIALISVFYWAATTPVQCTHFYAHFSAKPPFTVTRVECVENPVMAFIWNARHQNSR